MEAGPADAVEDSEPNESEAPVPVVAETFTLSDLDSAPAEPASSDASELLANAASEPSIVAAREPANEATDGSAISSDSLADALREATSRSHADHLANEVKTAESGEATEAPAAIEAKAEVVAGPAVETTSNESSSEEATAVAAEEKSTAGGETAAVVADEHPSGSVSAKPVESDVESTRVRKEEDLDASGVSAEFFRDDEASIAPTIENVHEESAPRIILTPAAEARRARFRRVVAGVVAFAGVISLAVIGKSIAAPARHHAPVAAVTAPAPVVPPPVQAPQPEPAKAEAATDTKPVEEKKADDAKEAKADEAKADEKKADDARADDTKEAKADDKADEKKADDAKADDAKEAKADDKADDKKDEPAGEPNPAEAKKLQQETLALLNRGRSKDAIEKAREAIAADPTDAIGYLYLGSALQDSGKWKDGIEAYSECVRHATKGSVNECKIMGGHK